MYERVQVQAKEPLGTVSYRSICENSSGCWLLIGHKKCLVLLCPIGEQFLLSSFRVSTRHSRPQSPSFLGHVVGKRGALATGRLQIKPSGSEDENGRIMSESPGVYIAMKSAVKAVNGFSITRVMDVLSVFTFSYLKCLHS